MVYIRDLAKADLISDDQLVDSAIKHCSLASAVDRSGLNPYEFLSAVVSETGSKASRWSACIARSFMVGIPSGRILPLLFGIYTRFNGSGL